MASCPTEESYGYEVGRFEKDVDENFHCSICYNVLKEPRMCRNNEHMFCLDCITQHLNGNSETCPECNEHLSVDTLRRARVVNNYLSKLKINCDYASRGCLEFTCVEELKNHVANCGFAPVLCSNEGCGMELNRQERLHHETTVCEYKNVKCHECGQIQEDVRRLEGSLMKLDGKVEATKEKMQDNHVEMKNVVQKLKGSLMKLDGKVEARMEKMQDNHVEMKKVVEKLEGRLVGMNKMLNEKVEAAKRETNEVEKEVKDMKENLTKVNKDMDEVKMMMSQMLEKLDRIELLNEGMLYTPVEDILVTGGNSSTEIYSWEKNGWFKVSPMNEEHKGASSFIHQDQVFVVGGGESKTIETLNLNELPLKWKRYPGNLPYECDDHQTVVYQQRVIHIGGYNYEIGERSNLISELQLTPPLCSMTKLCQMPGPLECHRAEIFDEKILIVGGRINRITDDVLEFDVKKNECEEMPQLPCALAQMATVRWQDKVVLLGGRDGNNEVLNDVFMYDSKTGETTALPSMLEKRDQCCAVITGNTIVVMGGENDYGDNLSSVELFTMGGHTWEYLPPMNEARCRAVAEVLPPRRKYV